MALREVPLAQIECIDSRLNTLSEIEDISHSLSNVGQLAPILLREHPSKTGSYQVIFGNRRVTAAKNLGWKTIRAEVVERSEIDSLVLAFIENSDRKDFTDYEKALLFEKLHRVSGKTYSDIAKMIGRSPAYVSLHIAMLHLLPKSVAPDEERHVVLSALTEKHSRILAGIDDPNERWNTAKLVVTAKLGTRELERLCKTGKRNLHGQDDSTLTIRNIVQDLVKSMNSKNLSQVRSLYATNFTHFGGYPPFSLMENNDALQHILSMMRKIPDLDTKIEKMDVQISGKFAYVTVVASDTLNTAKRRIKGEIRATIILKKEDNWKIVHSHWSSATPKELLSLASE